VSEYLHQRDEDGSILRGLEGELRVVDPRCVVHAAACRLSLPLEFELIPLPYCSDGVVVETTQEHLIEVRLVVLQGHPEVAIIAQSVIQFFLGIISFAKTQIYLGLNCLPVIRESSDGRCLPKRLSIPLSPKDCEGAPI